VEVEVYEGERKLSEKNRLLGKFELQEITAAKSGVPSIKVLFRCVWHRLYWRGPIPFTFARSINPKCKWNRAPPVEPMPCVFMLPFLGACPG